MGVNGMDGSEHMHCFQEACTTLGAAVVVALRIARAIPCVTIAGRARGGPVQKKQVRNLEQRSCMRKPPSRSYLPCRGYVDRIEKLRARIRHCINNSNLTPSSGSRS